MRYTILCDGKVIAKFVNEHDRDLCFDVIAEFYDDVAFEKGDTEAAEGDGE